MKISLIHDIPIITKVMIKKIQDLEIKLEEMDLKYKRLELKYGDEVRINNRLIDILRSHNINWR